MRNLRLLVLLAPALLLPLACEDDPTAGTPVFNPPPPPGFEAGPMPEAGPIPDAGVDAADAADAADGFVPPVTKGVTVTVLDVATPVKDVRVILHDAAGAVIGDVMTDALGKVTIATAPSMVSVLTEFESKGTYPAPVTFLGVADGDALLVNLSDQAPVPTDLGKYNVSFGPAFAGAADYAVRVGPSCGAATVDPSMPLLVDLSTDCIVGAQAAVLASARDVGAIDLAFGFVKNVAKPAAVAVPANVGPISFTAAGVTTVFVTNLPANGQESRGDLFAIANGATFFATNTGGTLETGLTFATATGFADAYQGFTAKAYYDTGTRNDKVLVRREASLGAPANYAMIFDFATLLPSINNVTANNATQGRPVITLTSTAPLSGTDGMLMSVSFQNLSWRFVVPPATTTFKVPALPANAGMFTPTGNGGVPEVTVVEASLIPGYTELKKLPLTPSGLAATDTSRALPAAGTVRILRWEPSD